LPTWVADFNPLQALEGLSDRDAARALRDRKHCHDPLGRMALGLPSRHEHDWSRTL